MKDAKTMGGEAAFPVLAFVNQHGNASDPQFGLTRREYFAGLAMQGLLAHPCPHDKRQFPGVDGITKRAVEYADALLSALAKESDQ